jgi:hypothetical protein
MPYLIYAGVNSANKGGMSAKGWHGWRRGSHVYWEFGSIKIENHGVKQVRWAAIPQTDPPAKKRTVQRAKEDLERRIAQKEGRGYERMEPGRKILPRLLRKK